MKKKLFATGMGGCVGGWVVVWVSGGAAVCPIAMATNRDVNMVDL